MDVTEKLNNLIKELQGENNLITTSYECIISFKKKLILWESQLKNRNLTHFANLSLFQESFIINYDKFSNEINNLSTAFEKRFQELKKYEISFEIFTSPFDVDVNKSPAELQMELIDLQCNKELQHIFEKRSKVEFFQKFITEEKFPNLRMHALKLVSAFGSTYICEIFLSKMKYNKNKYRCALSDVNLENQLRCATTKIEVNIDILSNTKEKQKSH